MKKLVFALTLAAALFSAVIAGAKKPKKVTEPVIYPTQEEGWNKVAPEKYGYDSAKLEEVRKYIIDKTNITGVVVTVGGEMIFEYGATDRLSYIASCRKSIMAMMYGKYVENGTINLKTTIGELGIDDIGGLLDIEKKATIDNLITARSGVYHDASNAGYDLKNRPERGSKKPGEFYLYNNWDFNVAGTVFEQLTGKNIYDAFYEDIGSHIGMQDWDRSAQKKGGNLKVSVHPAYHFYFSTRDMARLGYLMLRKGNWNGDQVISEKWVKKITSVVSTAEEVGHGKKVEDQRMAYGYMWWLYNPKYKDFTPDYEGAFAAHGYMGQYIKVFPAADMVVAIKTDAKYGRRTKGAMGHKVVDLIFASKVDNK